MSNDIITISSALLKNCSVRHVSNRAQRRIHLNRLNKPYFLPRASFRARIYAHTNLAIVHHFYGVSPRTRAEFHTDCKLSDRYNPITNANQNDELPGNNLKRQVRLCALAGKKKEEELEPCLHLKKAEEIAPGSHEFEEMIRDALYVVG